MEDAQSVIGPHAGDAARARQAGDKAFRSGDPNSAVMHWQVAIAGFGGVPGAELDEADTRISLALAFDQLGRNAFALLQSDLALALLGSDPEQSELFVRWTLVRVTIERHNGRPERGLRRARALCRSLERAGVSAVDRSRALIELARCQLRLSLHEDAVVSAREACVAIAEVDDEGAAVVRGRALVALAQVAARAVCEAEGASLAGIGALVEEAGRALDSAASGFAGLGSERDQALCAVARVEVMQAARRSDEALRCAREALALVSARPDLAHAEARLRCRMAGLLAATPGREAEADAQFRLSLARFEALECADRGAAACKVAWGAAIAARARANSGLSADERRALLRRAADLIVPAAMDADADRCALPTPDLRLRWREANRRTLALAMDLLFDLGEDERLADLIVASRVSGILDWVSVDGEVQLGQRPQPTLLMPNGRTAPGGDSIVRYR